MAAWFWKSPDGDRSSSFPTKYEAKKNAVCNARCRSGARIKVIMNKALIELLFKSMQQDGWEVFYDEI